MSHHSVPCLSSRSFGQFHLHPHWFLGAWICNLEEHEIQSVALLESGWILEMRGIFGKSWRGDKIVVRTIRSSLGQWLSAWKSIGNVCGDVEWWQVEIKCGYWWCRLGGVAWGRLWGYEAFRLNKNAFLNRWQSRPKIVLFQKLLHLPPFQNISTHPSNWLSPLPPLR